MAEAINCDLRCDICPNGAQWDARAPELVGKLTEIAGYMATVTSIASRALNREAPEYPAKQDAYKRVIEFGEVVAGLAAEEAALRASLCANLARINAVDCAGGDACRLGLFLVSGKQYLAESLEFAVAGRKKAEEF